MFLGLLSCSVALGQDDSADQGMRQIEAMEAAFRRAIDRAQPSLVSIFLVSEEFEANAQWRRNLPPGRNRMPMFEEIDDGTPLPPFSGFGSGIIVDKRGLVLTCYHVVRGATNNANHRLRVQLHDGRVIEKARIYAADPRSDLAVIELQPESTRERDAPFEFKPIAIADGSKLFRGQFVLALGNPYASADPDGSLSASWGIISNIRRRAVANLRPNASLEEMREALQGQQVLVQSDARLNMGVSGGALINIKGELVGITMALSALIGFDSPGGFALPTDVLTRRIIETLRQGKEVEYGFLGVGLGRSSFGQDIQQRPPVAGAEIGAVHLPTTIRAGLKDGDIVTAIDGERVKNQNDLILRIGSMPVGTVVKMDVMRQEKKLTLSVPLGKFPLHGEIIAVNKRPTWQGIRVDHLSLAVGSGLEIPTYGVYVREVQSGSHAFDLGIREGDVVTRFNGETIETPDEFEAKTAKIKLPARLTNARGREFAFQPETNSKNSKKE